MANDKDKKRKRKKKEKKNQEHVEAADLPIEDKKNKKRKLLQQDEDEAVDHNKRYKNSKHGYDADDQEFVKSDLCCHRMARHTDTLFTEQETHRLAVVNIDWELLKAVDLYEVVSSFLPKGGQILSVGIYPSEFGLKCMEVEAVHGTVALIDNNEEESESEEEISRIEKLHTYELNKLRYYYGVMVFDSSATAKHIYNTVDGVEFLRTSNVFDLRFIPDSIEFKHPPRDITTEAPTGYTIPNFRTHVLQGDRVPNLGRR